MNQSWEKTDAYLVKQCLSGNSRAWASLMDRYKRLIYHFPARAGLSSEDCDEVFQETVLAFYKQLDRIERVDDLSYWLSKVAQRNTWKAINRNLKYAELPATYDVADPGLIAEEDLELKIQQFKIRRGLNQMNKRCRDLLWSLFFETKDSDYKKIAKELGIAMGSIGPTRNRCLAKLKKILEKMGIDEKNVSKWLS